MARANKKSKKVKQKISEHNTKLAQEVATFDDPEIVAVVESNNDAVDEVLVIRDSDDQADSKPDIKSDIKETHTEQADKPNIIDDVKETKETIQEVVTETVNDLTDKVQDAFKTDDIKSNDTDEQTADEMHASAKSFAKPLSRVKRGGIGAKLGQMGAYLSDLTADQAKSYAAVDLQQTEFKKDMFHEQSSHLAMQLLGPKAATVQGLMGKFIAPNKVDGVMEIAYQKIATWAQAWAMKDLQKRDEFAQLATLDDASRATLLADVVHQNRALATLGGIAGLAGLKGVVIDTVWLLFVSLRTVYQVAAVSNQPLIGKDGIKKAYGMLSGANLQKLQEKQIIMTALTIGQGMLAKAQETGLQSEIQALGGRYQASKAYTDQFVKLQDYVDLDKFNPSWLNKLLPLIAVGVGAHYNHQLIDEVIGTALATFNAPKALEPKAAKEA
ncbi:hypothetical protein NKT77_06275 [Moraxella sp. FZLJ2107]|uniref:hypothetical protein n=1 Tax=unclassified Moraxella TaxID=2685852 RepID=UPI0020C910B7|nr:MULTISPECIES: hypothetical protein [unclassified Moraxella]UTO04145.1 hypothetical protein NKT77_06275 [Moraxella sp. FZLJ2107]UTO22978.1 hypothetical protein NKU06_03060 [Moraxella sp. FZLJ2109]